MVEGRELFLEKKTLKEAVKIWDKFIDGKGYPFVLGTEFTDTEKAAGRISADTVYSAQSSPFYTASAVDGIAVNAEKTAGASVSNPKILLLGKDGILVNTGDPLPLNFNAVIMIENVEMLNGKKFRILSSVPPYKNVRLIGEDIGIKETILFPNERITPANIGVLLAGGITKVKVYKKPKVLIIPTGEEIKKPGKRIKVGDIIDTNSYMFKSMVEQNGGEAKIAEIHPNNVNAICRTLENNKDFFDLFTIEGGSAKGSKDLTAKVFQKTGKIFIHGISIQPGKPAILGAIFGKPAFGMPGFPVSSFIIGHLFLGKTITKMQGLKPPKPAFIKATIKRPLTSSIGVTEFVRVKLGKVNKEIVAVPLKKGAGVLSSVSNADGLLKVDFDREGIEPESRVKIELLKNEDPKNGIIFIGSNDPLLNFLFSYVKKKNPNFHFGIISSGSLGGLLAFERGECNVTAAHLFDEKTETYNTPFLKKYLTKKYFTVRLSVREQGLIVAKGNPKRIKGINDLSRKDIIFVNRQKGSGTRVITDYLLKKNGIPPESVNGYNHEEYTHLAVANNVKLGGADCGVGIRYVADALGLDFIPLKKEPYDLVFLESERNREEIKLLLKFTKDEKFKKLAKKFAGYQYIGGKINEETQ